MSYGKGSIHAPELSRFLDDATGAQITQITSHPSINHPTYFLQSSFAPDGSAVLFTSYRTGSAQLFEASLPHGELRQLTAADPVHPFSAAYHPAGDRIVFTRGGGVWTLDRATLKEVCVVEYQGTQLGECSLGDGGQWLTAAIKAGNQSGIVAGRIDGSDWQFIPFGRTVIHPQFHPRDPEWIEFAADPAPRMHRVSRDGYGIECLYEHGNDEFVVHETFLGETGDLVYTVWPHALWRMNWETLERTPICEFNAWHIAPDQFGSRILCDTNHPDQGIWIVDAMDGSRSQICLSRATNQGSQWKTSRYALAEDFEAARSAAKSGALSWMETATDTVYGPQWTHPHPSWSPDGQRIAFASDRTGTTQVYLADLPAAQSSRPASGLGKESESSSPSRL